MSVQDIEPNLLSKIPIPCQNAADEYSNTVINGHVF